jgi:hypothetical protein
MVARLKTVGGQSDSLMSAAYGTADGFAPRVCLRAAAEIAGHGGGSGPHERCVHLSRADEHIIELPSISKQRAA